MKSRYDLDVEMMEPHARVDAELKLLKYHTPQMQATAVDVSVNDEKQSLSARLAKLAADDVDEGTTL